MKKKIAILLSMVLMLVIVSSCSSTSLELWTKTKEVQNWTANEIDMKGTVGVKFVDPYTSEEESIKFDMSLTGYINNKTLQGYLEMSFIEESGLIDIPEIKMFVDKTDIYFNKESFKQLFGYSYYMNNVEDIDAEYILISQDTDITNNLIEKDYTLVYEELANLIGLDLDVIKNENSYSITLDENSLIDKSLNIIDNAILNIDKIYELFEEEDLYKENIADIKSEYAANKESLIMYAEMAKVMIKGTEINLGFEFSDNSYKQTINGNIPISIPLGPSGVYKLSINFDFSCETKQVEEKVIEFPQNAVSLDDLDEYEDYFGIYKTFLPFGM